jgi:hypothetical protein
VKHYFHFTLYLETDVSGPPPDRKQLGERIAIEAMRALPVNLLTQDSYAVRLDCAEIMYRGHRIAGQSQKAEGRRRTASRRLLP